MTNDPDQLRFREIAPQRRDAIHRALLTGLLASIATKTDKHEYAGPRNVKLSIHPGSGLFKNQPQWIMAAELVETTRLYARTVARVTPQWIERAGEHLLKRSYSDPHWNDIAHHVNAYEKVTLFGLVLVPRRLVNFGPVDPKLSRELFILHALVDGRFKTAAPFFKRNHDLVAEVRSAEAKLRRRDLLVAPQQLFLFYNERLPAGVFDGPSFDKWFRHSEQHHRHQLLMSMSDVLSPDAPPIRRELFPDVLEVNAAGVRHPLPLHYVFEPGDPADGVTVDVPLTLLNAIDRHAFDWPVPGWLEDKIVALIRSLPRPLRTRLVPAPDMAARVAREIRHGEGSFYATVADRLGNIAGEVIPLSAFNLADVPDYLHTRVRIVDEAGKTLASSRDVRELREKLAEITRQTFKNLGGTPFTRNNLSRWDFGDLPISTVIKRPGITILGYPALVEEGQNVHLRLLESQGSAERAMRTGARRLFMLQLGGELKHLAKNIDGWNTMALHYAPLGPAEFLRDSLLQAAADEALYGENPRAIRTQSEFAHRAGDAWARLSTAVERIAGETAATLSAHHAVARLLEKSWGDRYSAAIRDVRQQLITLLPRDFLLTTPRVWRPHLPRFLRAIEVRLKKLAGSTAIRDAEMLSDVRVLQQRYVDAVARKPSLAELPEMIQYRWMLEELRVSLFAQELKTSQPASVQRLEKLWQSTGNQ